MRTGDRSVGWLEHLELGGGRLHDLVPGPDAAAGETIPPVPWRVLRGFGRPHELAHDSDEAGRVAVMREMSGLVEDLELAAREGEMGQAARGRAG